MDALFHLLLPLSFAELFHPNMDAPKIFILCFSALTPDLDVLPALTFKPGFHRGPTHSITFAVFTSLGLTVFLSQIGLGGFKTFFGVAFIGVFSHIALDLVTSRGIPIFWPLKMGEYSFKLFLAVDPIILASSVVYMFTRVFFWVKGVDTQLINLFFAAFFFSYLLVRVLGYSRALNLAKTRGFTGVFPTPNPLRWVTT